MATYSYWLQDLEERRQQADAARAPQQGTGLGRYLWPPRKKDRDAASRGIMVVTDTSSALPEVLMNTALGERLRQIIMPVMIGDQIHTDDIGEIHDELPLALAQGTPVRTSRPAPGEFRRIYRQVAEAGYTGILSVHLSGKLSGTVDAARLASTDSPIPVEVIDSGSTAMGMGYAVIDAAMKARSHTTGSVAGALAELAEFVQHQVNRSAAIFTVPNLEQLRRGGRISRMSGILGQLLQVRPVLTLTDGQIVLMDKPRTVQRANEVMIDHVRQFVADNAPVRLCVHGYGNMDAALALADELAELSTAPIPVLPVPPVLAAHLGLGVLGVTANPEPGTTSATDKAPGSQSPELSTD